MRALRRYAPVLLVFALAGGWWLAYDRHVAVDRCQQCALVRGGDGGKWPRATAQQEQLDGAVAARVVDYARQQDADALLVARHGHLIVALERNVDERIASRGLLAPLALLSGGLRPDPQRLSRDLWQPLNAQDARLRCGQEAGAVCTLWARPSDWLRVGQMLLEGGRFEGEQLLDSGVVTSVSSQAPAAPGHLLAASAAAGAEPLVDRRGDFLRGEGRTRLWLAPSVQLVVLLMANGKSAQGFDETELPNILVRGLRDRPAGSGAAQPVPADGAATLAPGH